MKLNKLPKKYHEVVKSIEHEDGLVDGCRYMLYFSDEYADNDLFGSCVPTRNVTEVIRFVKDVYESLRIERSEQ